MSAPKLELLSLVLVAVLTAAAAAEVRYTVTDLGTLLDASAINNAGQIVGYNGAFHACVWNNGTMTDLGTLGGSSRATGINGTGQVVGYSETGETDQYGNVEHPFLYSGGKMTDLGTLSGDEYLYTHANSINDSGQIVGVATTYGNANHAFLYSNGHMTDLGTLGGGDSEARGINNSGQIVGRSNTADGTNRAFLYTGGVMTAIGNLGDSTASAINSTGQVVGLARITYYHAFLYDGQTTTDLGDLGGHLSYAYGINNAGQVVGYSETGETDQYGNAVQHAFLYSSGTMTDLNNLIDPASDWTLSRASAINDSGQIVGYGRNSAGQSRPCLLTPIPEPATMGLLAVGLSVLVVRRRRAGKWRTG